MVLQPNIPDYHDDVFSQDVIEDAAYEYLAKHRESDLEHIWALDKEVELVESYIAPVDFELNGEKITKGTWIASFKVNDPAIWAAVEDGTFAGFSPSGVGLVDADNKDS